MLGKLQNEKGPVTGPLKILSSMFGQVYFKATRTTFSSKPFSTRTMYIPRGSEATSNLTSFSNLSDITSAPVMLYTETFDDVPAVFSTNNTSDAGFGFIVNEVNSSETPTFVQGPHSFQPKAGTIVSADHFKQTVCKCT